MSQQQRLGRLHPIVRNRRGPIAKVFWNYVMKTDGCWIWAGHLNEDGYGTRLESTPSGKIHVMAHRFSWELANGPVPAGMGVLHRCDNPPCVRPDHLFLGTNEVNQADKIAKGRQSRGEGAGKSSLTNSDIVDIRSIKAFGATLTDLAAAYDVSIPAISAIVRRTTWRHVP